MMVFAQDDIVRMNLVHHIISTYNNICSLSAAEIVDLLTRCARNRDRFHFFLPPSPHTSHRTKRLCSRSTAYAKRASALTVDDISRSFPAVHIILTVRYIAGTASHYNNTAYTPPFNLRDVIKRRRRGLTSKYGVRTWLHCTICVYMCS